MNKNIMSVAAIKKKWRHDAMVEYITNIANADVPWVHKTSLQSLSAMMVESLESDFVKSGKVALFNKLEKIGDMAKIINTIETFDCLEELERHLLCTLSEMPICRGVVCALLKNVASKTKDDAQS